MGISRRTVDVASTAPNPVTEVQSGELLSWLKKVDVQLRIMNLHLSMMTDNELTEMDLSQ